MILEDHEHYNQPYMHVYNTLICCCCWFSWV